MKARVAVYFYSTYGHMWKMAKAAAAGIEESGAEAVLLRVAETLPPEVLKAMGADEAQKAFAAEKTAKFEEFGDYDGYVFAFPTRFGVVPAQFKGFLDASGQVWGKGGLVNKPVGIMTSSAMQHVARNPPSWASSPLCFTMEGCTWGCPSPRASLARAAK